MPRITKADLSAVNARLEELLAEKEIQRAANDTSLIRVTQDFDAYRRRYAPVTQDMIKRWFERAVRGTTEEVLLRAYMEMLLDVMKRYGE